MAMTRRGERHETFGKNARFLEGKKRRWVRKEKKYEEVQEREKDALLSGILASRTYTSYAAFPLRA